MVGVLMQLNSKESMFRNLMIAMLLFTSACAGTDIRPLYPAFLPPPPEGGPQEFQQGWRDGCDTGLAQHGTDVYRTAFGFKQDPSQVLNPAYYKAWKDAENFCRTYIFEYSVRSLDVWCTVDGLSDDCGDTSQKSGVPFLGGSSDAIGYNFLGGGGVTAFVGGAPTDDFLGNTTDFNSVLGNW